MFPYPIIPYIREADFAVRRPWNVPARRLLNYLLIYVQEGRCLVQVEGDDYIFGQGEFGLIQPNTLHTLRGMTDTITPCAHMDIFYNPEREQSFPTRPWQTDLGTFGHLMQPRLDNLEGVSVPVRLEPSQLARFRETMLKMVGVWQQRDAISRLEAQLLATELVLLRLKDYSSPPASAPQRSQSLDWLTSYLLFHLSEPLLVEDMARRAHLSPSRFNAVFRQRFGTSPHQYLLRLRVQHAQELLNSTDFTLQKIAEYCGFADVHHFSKAFRKVTGLSPGAYRAGLYKLLPL